MSKSKHVFHEFICSMLGNSPAPKRRRSRQLTPAIDEWFAGHDATGRQPEEIRAPTLVADGTEDALDPVSNDHMLARLIHGAHLALYPGAGHGFLFQDSQSFVAELTSFLR